MKNVSQLTRFMAWQKLVISRNDAAKILDSGVTKLKIYG